MFRDQEFTGDTRSGPVERIAAVRMLKTHQFPEDAGPLAHPVRPASYIEINNFYTATVYEKGAEVCRMLQTLLGRDGFRKGLDLYFERHDGEAVTVEDFVEAMADVSGRDLSQFMLWYTQSGTPELACSLDYDAHAKTARLAVSQVVPPTPGQTKKEPMLIPLKVGLIGANGDELPLQARRRRRGLRRAARSHRPRAGLRVPRRALPRRRPRCCAASRRRSASPSVSIPSRSSS